MKHFIFTLLSLIVFFTGVGCVNLGPELRPYPHPDVDGFVVTLHSKESGEYQIAVWHPKNNFYAFSGNSNLPFQAKLIGDPQTPFTSTSESKYYSSQGCESGIKIGIGNAYLKTSSRESKENSVISSTTRTVWSFTRERWEEKRPFRLVIIRGFAPLFKESRMEIDINLGPIVGSAEGLTVNKTYIDPVPVRP